MDSARSAAPLVSWRGFLTEFLSFFIVTFALYGVFVCLIACYDANMLSKYFVLGQPHVLKQGRETG